MTAQAAAAAAPAPLRGVLAVFQTPFTPDLAIDYLTLGREIDWLFEQGVDGIAMAMVSELLRLSSEERDQLAAAACRLAAGRGAVVISVGAESTHLAVRHARAAQAAGATALMANPPIAAAPDECELRGYYEAILKATELPLVVQDASGYVGKPMSIALQAALSQTWGERILFKPEAVPLGPRLSQLREAGGGRTQVFEGSGGIALVDSYRRGICGTMPGADLIDFIVALWRALQAGDEARTYQLSLPLSALVALQHGLDGFLAIEKYLLVKRGVFVNTLVRGPVAYSLDAETRAEVDRLFALCQAALAAEGTS